MGIALGSIGELETHLIISNKIEYLPHGELNPLLSKLDDFRKMLKSLCNTLT